MSCWYEIHRDAGPRRLPIGEVRHLLSYGQVSITLVDPPAENLPIVWIWRTGGTFGSQSSEAANDRQRIPRSTRDPMPVLDRGTTGGWIPLWLCPGCGRRARVLVNPLMNWLPEAEHLLRPHWPSTWRCLICSRYRYPCQRRPGAQRGQGKPPSWHYDAHMAAAERVRQAMDRPQRLTWERRMALESLAMAHHRLAIDALGQAIPSRPGGLPPAVIEQAWETIRRHRWAMRQTSWHRAGKPRPGPEARAAQQHG
jgi:hypothetical protein